MEDCIDHGRVSGVRSEGYYSEWDPEFGQAAMARKLGVSQSLLSLYIRS